MICVRNDGRRGIDEIVGGGVARGCFGISGEVGIVVALMVTADLRVVFVSSNLLKKECRCQSFNRNLPY